MHRHGELPGRGISRAAFERGQARSFDPDEPL